MRSSSRLKAINDRVGHDAGDELLTGVLAQIRKQIRSYDLIMRLGGDGAFRVGFAQFQDGQSAGDLIACVDRQLLAARRPDLWT